MGNPDKPLFSVILQTLLDCINVLERDDSKFSWKLTRHLKGFCMPASGSSRQIYWWHAIENIMRKRKKKSPFTVTKDRAEDKRFGKQKKSKKISNDQELKQSDPISCPQNQEGNNYILNLPRLLIWTPGSSKQRRIPFLKSIPFIQNKTVLLLFVTRLKAAPV